MAYTTINKPADYFNTKLYTGNGTDDHAITGVGFQPDWVWIKNRGASANHMLYDVARGATKALFSNATSAENTSSGHLKSFDSDGFTLGDNSGTGSTNGNTETYASWNWLAGGSASSNTDGTITSSVSANTTAGFSIVKYTGNSTAGATVGHGLDAVPNVRITKRLTNADSWDVYHSGVDVTGDYTLRLNETGAKTNGNNTNNDTAPTSSVFTLGSDAMINGSSNDYISYCFAEKKGFSKFGSYLGNGSTDGAFVYTGFKPAFVMWKSSSAAGGHWVINDNTRNPRNQSDNVLFPNLTNSVSTTEGDLDFVSNGFKFRGSSNNNYNHSGVTYIFMAFAENPLVTSGGTPATAR